MKKSATVPGAQDPEYPGIPPDLESLAVPIADLAPYEHNPRQGDVGGIVTSLEHNGQYRPIVVNRRGNVILAGNHTFWAAKELGWRHIAATFVDVDDELARRIVLIDNRANDLASYDDAALADLLTGIVADQGAMGLLGTGFDAEDLDDLLGDLERARGGGDPDAAPALPAKPVTKPGDLWQLGEHRLLCGDATKVADLERLLDGDRPGLCWTDPPYGVDYEGKTKEKKRIQNDHKVVLADLLRESFAAIDTVLAPGAAVYVAHPAGALSVIFAQAFIDQGWRLHETLIWVKDSMVLGHSDYHYRHEQLLYGFTQGGGRRGRGGKGWFGDSSQTTVFEVPRPKSSQEHPTMKPVELVEIGLRNSSEGGGAVLDPFGGSGSTLLAAERLGRRARPLELDPAYCDVVVRRWEDFTGMEASRG